jgi:hypothetical protein
MIFAIAAVKSPASRTGGKASGTTQAVQTQPQCHGVAAESEFDGLTGQAVGFALERRSSSSADARQGCPTTPSQTGGPAVFAVIHEIISRY